MKNEQTERENKMSESTHTPGPWEEIKCGFIHGPIRKPKNYATQVSICRVTYPTRPLNKNDPWDMQFPANARLIAAAPELLDALENLVGAVRHLDPCSGSLQMAEAAIKKAKGLE